jgi:hypothetical protein
VAGSYLLARAQSYTYIGVGTLPRMLRPAAEFKLRLMDPKEVLTECFRLYRFPTLVNRADKHLIFGIQRDKML